MRFCGDQRTSVKLLLRLLGLSSELLYPVTRSPTDLSSLLTFWGLQLALTRRLTPFENFGTKIGILPTRRKWRLRHVVDRKWVKLEY